MDNIIIPRDQRTRVAVQATYLRQALEALRRAIQLEDDDAWRADLTDTASALAGQQRRAGQQYTAIREREAAVARAALEG